MKHKTRVPYTFTTIADLHRMLNLPGPEHPLVSVIDMSTIPCHFDAGMTSVIYSFYSVCIKKGFKGQMKYGQNTYDFDHGIMTFFSPGQVVSTVTDEDMKLSGIWLVVHPDFLRGYPLLKKIREYGYFSYAVNEALHLSEKEEAMITAIMENIQQEYHAAIDSFSQDVMISQIELLLNYCNRYYNRQFITRRQAGNDLLVKLEDLLDGYFTEENLVKNSLPTVQDIAGRLNVSPNYLSDLLRTLTGRNTQQHIHDKLIDKAKEVLTTTSLSVSEIAYRLGFEYPQSFSKLFRNKTQLSPLAFRQSFN